jgi:hypothetical protein
MRRVRQERNQWFNRDIGPAWQGHAVGQHPWQLGHRHLGLQHRGTGAGGTENAVATQFSHEYSLDLVSSLGFEPPWWNAGDQLVFRAKIGLLVALPAWPQNMLTIDGERMRTVEMHLQVQS